MGYYVASSGNYLPTFRDNLSAPTSRPSPLQTGPIGFPKRLQLPLLAALYPQKSARLSRNVDSYHYLLSYSPRRALGCTETSTVTTTCCVISPRALGCRETCATGIDAGTVRQVAQRLNHYATPGPPSSVGTGFISGGNAAGA